MLFVCLFVFPSCFKVTEGEKQNCGEKTNVRGFITKMLPLPAALFGLGLFCMTDIFKMI